MIPNSPKIDSEKENRLGFVNLAIGGTGANGITCFDRIVERNGCPFPCANLVIDTDPSTFRNANFDQCLPIKVNQEILSTLKGNANLFAPEVAQILLKQARMLASGDIENGMRTTRPLTQLVFRYYASLIRLALRRAVDSVAKKGANQIIITIVSSTGGGTGSAGTVLLLQELSRPQFVHSVLMGRPKVLLLPPMVMVAEPLAFARQKEGMQQKKILSNAYAFRLETDELIRRGCPVQYLFHIGFSNEEGTCVETKEQIGGVLGNSLYALERNYPELKRDWVDGPDDAAVTDHPQLMNSLSNSSFRKNGDASSTKSSRGVS